ncbi:GMC family oxidoreductase N-terminal domain-containing protein [Streptomyces sp. NPDC058469]|uniref:GMC family oxidoreductase N-terminal domain-containing protein n=1 Tax=Streptomyces sp. NPDC058469 TaxID=3346514 RepID=UPI0036599B31
MLDSPLLTELTGARAAPVLVEGGRARGVEIIEGGRLTAVRCAGDVVLSCGTIGSAQLLLLGGTGPADELRALGVGVVADVPGAGANLHDHALARCAGRARRTRPGTRPSCSPPSTARS